MLSFALDYRAAIKEFTADAENNLRDWELSLREWELLESLRDSLKVLYDATNIFSTQQPTIAEVISIMDKIDSFLATRIIETPTDNCTQRVEVSEALKTSLILAKRTLNKYYTLTDSSSVYRIAMVLHPSKKLEYFREQNWAASWVDEAHKITRDKYIENYHIRTDLLGEEKPSHRVSSSTSFKPSKSSEKRIAVCI
ncbi:hypothetical protein K435DRAFT_646377 [Dendrothele bispora CBS 962.96]|uniref:hAT-like transposase RNase-H fold domain-containing protein n=1 Tax=Dendrothele bispora (strain CBS 962.96) TaxID=1314807 RepID=A0A4V4HIA3_DENBC|nr:hypothetical protein K435DRAFT_646377 [Dendrothele bispora CBS 962.96]